VLDQHAPHQTSDQNPWQVGDGGQGTPAARPVLTKQGFLVLRLQQELRE